MSEESEIAGMFVVRTAEKKRMMPKDPRIIRELLAHNYPGTSVDRERQAEAYRAGIEWAIAQLHYDFPTTANTEFSASILREKLAAHDKVVAARSKKLDEGDEARCREARVRERPR